MPLQAPQPQSDQSTSSLPPGVSTMVFEAFEGINTTTLRPGVDDKECAWLDGFMPLGPGRNLRTMPDRGPTVAPFAANSIVFFDFANIGSTPYGIVFASDGSISALNTTTGAETQLAVAGTITNPSRANIGMAAYGNRYVLIVAVQANGYFIWDGTTFYFPGNLAPGGGGNVPTAIGGSAIEVYAGRIWIANGASVTFSAPGSIWDFTTGSGGGNFTSNDSFLRVEFIELRQTNGFLYLIADSSVNYISGVSTSGSPPTTTYTNQNLDPEVGTPWPGTVDVFNRNIIFANPFGAHIGYGGAISKISDKLDGVYNSVTNFAPFIPSAAKAILYGKKIWILLLPIIDPVTGQQVNKLLCWNSKIWWAASQSSVLTFIQHQEINSVLTAWGTDGTNIFRLFNNPASTFTKVAQTKLWDVPGYEFYKFTGRLWGLFQFYSNVVNTLTISIDNETNSATDDTTLNPLLATWTNQNGNVVTWTNSTPTPVTWLIFGAGFVALPPTAVGQNGVLIGLTLETNAADMAIVSMKISEITLAYRG